MRQSLQVAIPVPAMVLLVVALLALDGCARAGFRWGVGTRDASGESATDGAIALDVADIGADQPNDGADAGADQLHDAVDVGADQQVDAAVPAPWARRFGGALAEQGSCAAVDSAGNIAVAGDFEGTVDFGTGALTSAGGTDVFVASFDRWGNTRWARRLGGGEGDSAHGVAADSSGNIVVTGYFAGTADTGAGALTSSGDQDIFVASYTAADGSPRWARSYGGPGADIGRAVAVDSSGNVVIAGSFEDDIELGLGGTITSVGSYDAFVASYADSGGMARAVRRLGGTGSDHGYGVAVDSSGNVTVTGSFESVVDFGAGPLTSAGALDVFVASYEATSAHRWSRRFGGGSDDSSVAVAVDGSGNAVVAGYFEGTADFGTGALTSAGFTDVFLASYENATGNARWARRLGGTNYVQARAVAVDGAGQVAITGYFEGTADFGSGALTAAGQTDAFVAGYEGADGSVRWARRLGGIGWEIGYGVAAGSAGSVVATGFFAGTVDFGVGSLTADGQHDVYLLYLP